MVILDPFYLRQEILRKEKYDLSLLLRRDYFEDLMLA